VIKCAIGHLRTNTFDRGSIVFLCQDTANTVQASMSSERMRITSDGRVGIATATPDCMLEVGSASAISTATGLIPSRYFNVNAPLSTTSGTRTNMAVKIAGGIWITGDFVSSSDSRIKEDIQDINDDSALQSILAIEPKTYKYIDKVAKGYSKVYGFIAQQVRAVVPDATSIEKGYIPNIMLLADYNDCIITLPSQPTIVIKQGDKIRGHNEENGEVPMEVEEVIDELTYRVKMLGCPYNDNKIFLFGTQVEDFHTLNKDYIFTLNVCATQELHRKIKSQEARIKELETKMEQILKYISE
jgi:hypothetical protein